MLYHRVHQGEACDAPGLRVAEGLRDQGIDVVLHCGGGSFKSQMKKGGMPRAPCLPSSSATTRAAAGEVTAWPYAR